MKKIFFSLTLLGIFFLNSTSADMTKKVACNLEDGYYQSINLATIWKPYEQYNTTVKSSYQKKTVDVNGFFKSEGYLYYIVNFQILDMTYIVRSNLFSYQCTTKKIKQLSKINMGSGEFFSAKIVNYKNGDFLILKELQNTGSGYYAVYHKLNDSIEKVSENNLKSD